MAYMLGKTQPKPINFKFGFYAPSLPEPPKSHPVNLKAIDSNMFMNDRLGDCVCAGAAHETIHWNAEVGRFTHITDDDVVSMYSQVAGYVPGNPNTDQGTNMADAASWRRKVGILDAAGNRHLIDAYMALAPGNVTQLKQAIYYFGAAGVGVEFPSSAMDQFDQGRPWTVKQGSQIEGGHYVAAVGYNTKYIYIITWGRLQKMSWAFYKKYNDESYAYLTQEMLLNGVSPEGFNLAQLQSDLAAL